MRSTLAALAGLVLLGLVALAAPSGVESGMKPTIPPPEKDLTYTEDAGEQTAVLAGGCFWCTEAVYEQLPGVSAVVSGYAGGSEESAKYDIVSAGRTDHAEAIRITYDPARITYGQLLHVFFGIAHDPTQLNRQGPDHGRQYRSAIFYETDEQREVAEAYIRQLEDAKAFDKPIVTTLEPLSDSGFYEAETHHQDFVQRNPTQPYVSQYAVPKVEKAKQYVEAEQEAEKQ